MSNKRMSIVGTILDIEKGKTKKGYDEYTLHLSVEWEQDGTTACGFKLMSSFGKTLGGMKAGDVVRVDYIKTSFTMQDGRSFFKDDVKCVSLNGAKVDTRRGSDDLNYHNAGTGYRDKESMPF